MHYIAINWPRWLLLTWSSGWLVARPNFIEYYTTLSYLVTTVRRSPWLVGDYWENVERTYENHNTWYQNNSPQRASFIFLATLYIFRLTCMSIHIFKILEMGWLNMYLYKTIKVERYPWIDKSMDLHLSVALPNASFTVGDYQSMGQVWPLTSGDISIETPWPHDKNHC